MLTMQPLNYSATAAQGYRRKQQLTVFGQGPHFIVNDQLKLVNMVSDLTQVGLDLALVSHRPS